LEELRVTMKHARTFITSRQKMNPVGVELYDELTTRLDEIANAKITGVVKRSPR
jgi:hypothetical protein